MLEPMIKKIENYIGADGTVTIEVFDSWAQTADENIAIDLSLKLKSEKYVLENKTLTLKKEACEELVKTAESNPQIINIKKCLEPLLLRVGPTNSQPAPYPYREVHVYMVRKI